MIRAAVIASVALAACQNDSMAVEAAGPSAGQAVARTDNYCRTERPYQLAPYAVWKDLLAADGGFSCYRAGGTVVTFHHTAKAPCEPDRATGSATLRIDQEQAKSEFETCSALGHPSSSEPTNVLIVLPVDGATDAQTDEFFAFADEVPKLLMFDGLPATHFHLFQDVICMETDRPDDLFLHIEQANIVEGTAVQVIEAEATTCRSELPELTGLPYREVARMEIGPGTPFFGE